ncbi:MAG: IclR family transcriptional regulator [Opitutaceae bacterium]
MNKYTIPNLKNACRVMQMLPENKGGMTIEDLSRSLNVPRTSMLRIVSTLEESGFVERVGRRFFAGGRLLQMGLLALKENNLRVLSAPILAELSQTTGETAHLAQLSGKQMLIIEVSESPNTVRAALSAGRMVDTYCSATGKVMMTYTVNDLASFLEGVDLESRTENTKTTLSDMEAECIVTRERGYALDDIEYVEGVRCLAAPVYNGLGDVVAAIGITASILSFTRDRIDEMAEQVIAAAGKLSQAFGAE